ncbi:MAG: hypothetical protein WCE79_02210 [Xanthobacteraceae bacterium]
MSANEKDDSAQGIEETDKQAELAQSVARFAQYTSPIMLAMLASGGHNMAFALVSPPPP